MASPLAPATDCELTIEFSPCADGERTARLVVQQNIPLPDHGTPLELIGTGTGAEEPAGSHTLTVTVDTSTAAFRVTSTPSGIDCPEACTATFDDGTVITLTAIHDQNDGQADWDRCSPAAADECQIRLNADRAVTAACPPDSGPT